MYAWPVAAIVISAFVCVLCAYVERLRHVAAAKAEAPSQTGSIELERLRVEVKNLRDDVQALQSQVSFDAVRRVIGG